MKIGILTLTIPVTLFAVLATPIQLAAQHTRYKLIDIGTFGGPVDLNNPDPRELKSAVGSRPGMSIIGEISQGGVYRAGCDDLDACGHDFLLIPCDNTAACEGDTGATTPANRNNAAVITKSSSISTRTSRTPMQRLAGVLGWRSDITFPASEPRQGISCCDYVNNAGAERCCFTSPAQLAGGKESS
jgi:hypothetical protein